MPYPKPSLILAVLAFLLILVTGCSQRSPAPTQSAQAPSEPDLVILDPAAIPQLDLRVDSVRTTILPEELAVTGRIGVDEDRTSRVGVLAGGRIVKVLASAGDHVKKGALLAQISSHEVHDARSEYAKAISEMQRRRAELEYAENARDRTAKLYKLKAASLEQLERAETDLRASELGIQAAQAEINRIEESLRHLGISSETAVSEYSNAEADKASRNEYDEEELVPVLAPIDGVIMERMASPGMVVTPSNDLFVVSDLSKLWINAQVPEKNLASIKVGRSVGITVQAYEGIVFPAIISLVGTSLDPDTRTLQVRCEAKNADGRLKPEMYATVRIAIDEGFPRPSVPASAIQDIDGQSVVFARESPNRFRARQIHIGRQAGTDVEVLDGIKPGETIVVTGSFLLKSELLKRRFSVE